MVAIEHKANFPVSVTEHAVMSPAGIFVFDKPKTAGEHFHGFCDLGGAKLIHAESGKLALVCGVASGLVVLQIGKGRGSFVPNLNPGRYGVEHTALGNLFAKTKRIMDLNTGTAHIILGIVRDEWPDGLNSCTLVQLDLEGCGPISLLADGSEIPIEPTPGFRFYTPFYHIPGAGSGFITRDSDSNTVKPRPPASVYPSYLIGIVTLDRESLSELLRAFNKDWTNGPVFARKNPIIALPCSGNGGLEKWC